VCAHLERATPRRCRRMCPHGLLLARNHASRGPAGEPPNPVIDLRGRPRGSCRSPSPRRAGPIARRAARLGGSWPRATFGGWRTPASGMKGVPSGALWTQEPARGAGHQTRGARPTSRRTTGAGCAAVLGRFPGSCASRPGSAILRLPRAGLRTQADAPSRRHGTASP
jgi:hypothetical protein